jgi:lysophospholipase L1-like esterase
MADKKDTNAKEQSDNSAYRHTLLGKPSRTLCYFILLALLPYFIPGLTRYRLLIPAKLVEFVKSRSINQPIANAATGQNSNNSSNDDSASANVQVNLPPGFQPGEIEDASGHALDNFFAALFKSESEDRCVRVSHYGDSPITADGITSTVRNRLQEKFGDAGHGFILLGNPWGWYSHFGVVHKVGNGWRNNPMFISAGDHKFGLGGASFTTRAGGVTASFSTVDDGKFGRSVSAFDIYFLQQPGGGDFLVEIDGKLNKRVSTAGGSVESGFYQADVEPGPHSLTIRTVGNGEVRMFGVVLNNGNRGVQYDSIGVNGAYVGLLVHFMDAQHWSEQLRHRNPDLVILGYGTNESEYESLSMKLYESDLKSAIGIVRESLPDASIMLVGPMDRGKRGPGGEIITRPMIPKLINYQRRIAAETGCAFFDTFTAMGGAGTIARWYEARPRLIGGDFTHPTGQGSEIVGGLIGDAILKRYEQYRLLAITPQNQK